MQPQFDFLKMKVISNLQSARGESTEGEKRKTADYD